MLLPDGHGCKGKKEKLKEEQLPPDAEETATEVIFYINFAAGAITAEKFHALER